MQNIPLIKLNNGVSIPQLGLGVWQASNEEAESTVLSAFEAGYRLIDTAKIYNNETGVGAAIQQSSLPREELFITTKLWNEDQGYDETLRAFDASLGRLGLDYVDLYLIHWPMPVIDKYKDTWRAFEKLYADKRIRAIGVSNFVPEHLQALLDTTNVTPVLNQIELHPYLQQHETREFCAKHDIKIESWSPIGGKNGTLLDNVQIGEIATAHSKSPAQVIIRWHIQNGFIVIPKSVHAERIQENINVFDFELNDAEMTTINALHTGERQGPDPRDMNRY